MVASTIDDAKEQILKISSEDLADHCYGYKKDVKVVAKDVSEECKEKS